MGVLMRLFQQFKGLIFNNSQRVTPTTKTAVLSRVDPQTGEKMPVYARPKIAPEVGLPSERFDRFDER